MSEFRFVRIDKNYLRDPRKILEKLRVREGVYLEGTNIVGALWNHTIESMKTLSGEKRVIILNEAVNWRDLPSTLRSNTEFPFASIYKNASGFSVVEKKEALVEGNYFLCRDIEEADAEAHTEGLEYSDDRPYIYEYKHHASLEDVSVFRTKYPAYVNLDRSSDNIGGSSWDGNLVRFLRSGFTTRIQFAVQAGLLPEE